MRNPEFYVDRDMCRAPKSGLIESWLDFFVEQDSQMCTRKAHVIAEFRDKVGPDEISLCKKHMEQMQQVCGNNCAEFHLAWPPEHVVEVPLPIPRLALMDLLVTAFEGGCNHWLRSVDAVIPGGTVLYLPPGDPQYSSGWHKIYRAAVTEGCYLNLYPDIDAQRAGMPGPYRLDLEVMKKGIRLVAEEYPSMLHDVMSGEGDVDVADLFFQLCLFDEVVFS